MSSFVMSSDGFSHPYITKLNFVMFSIIVNLVNVQSATVKLFDGGLD